MREGKATIDTADDLPELSQPTDRSRVLTLALPAVGEQVLNMMIGLADTYLVGHLGAAALSAVGLGNQMVMLATAFYSAVGTGGTALVARHVGAREHQMANRIMHQSLIMAGIIGLASTIFFHTFAEQCLVLLNSPADVVGPGANYLSIVSFSFLASALMFMGMAALRGAGDTRTPMLVMVIVNVVNIVVAWACIYGAGPIPALGVAGSAIGAAVARSFGGVVILGVLLGGRAGLRLRLSSLRLDLVQARRILNIGIPAGMEMLLMRFGQIAYAMVVAGLGTAAFAAHQLALTSESLAYMPGFGFAVAATTLVGQGLGARDPRRAEQGGYESLRLSIIIMSAMGVVFFLFAPQFIGLFTSDPEVIELGIWPLRLVAFSQPALACAMVLSGGLRGAGDTRRTLLITGVGLWLVRVPMALLLTGPFGLIGAWIAMGLDINVRGLAVLLRFRSGRWKELRV
jgi:putative MATE family efflux protein